MCHSRVASGVHALRCGGAAPEMRDQWTPLATRLWRIERENVLGRLREHGVPVVAWAGAGSLDLVLRDVSRLASAPRGH